MKQALNLLLLTTSIYAVAESDTVRGVPANVALSINNTTALEMAVDVDYDFTGSPRLVIVELNEPIICHSVSGNNSSTPTGLQVFDPNSQSPLVNGNDDLLLGITALNYDLANNLINVMSDEVVQCASKNGLILGNDLISDLIFADGFEINAGLPDITTQIVAINPGLLSLVSPGQVIEYQLHFTNNGGSQTNLDILDFTPNINGGEPYFTGSWNCVGGQAGADCGSSAAGQTVELIGASIDPGMTLIVDVSRTVVSASTTGTMEILVAAFVDGEDSAPSNNVDYRLLSLTANQQPTITIVGSSQLVVDEDQTISGIEFTVNDFETANGSLIVTATNSTDPSVVPITAPQLIVTGSGNSRFVAIDQIDNHDSTLNSPITITIAVDDLSGCADQTTFDLTVNPINDQPSFIICGDISHDILSSNVTCGVARATFANFVTSTDFGSNESGQSVLAYELVGFSGNTDIFDDFTVTIGEPDIFILNDGTLSYDLSGEFGTATLQFQMTDDGATGSPSDVNVSPIMEFDFTVPGPNVSIFKTVYFGNDSGTSCDGSALVLAENS
ncbi:MAG: hypothetical protein L3J52_02560, partial [Proteobacteria bacterium]|nr:hypothetical protein [Pseudomonadota bacterium]